MCQLLVPSSYEVTEFVTRLVHNLYEGRGKLRKMIRSWYEVGRPEKMSPGSIRKHVSRSTRNTVCLSSEQTYLPQKEDMCPRSTQRRVLLLKRHNVFFVDKTFFLDKMHHLLVQWEKMCSCSARRPGSFLNKTNCSVKQQHIISFRKTSSTYQLKSLKANKNFVQMTPKAAMKVHLT